MLRGMGSRTLVALLFSLADPAFAIVSANSFPSNPLWAGIQLRVTLLVLPRELRRFDALSVVLLLITVELIACMADLLSQLIKILLQFGALSRSISAVLDTAKTSAWKTVLF